MAAIGWYGPLIDLSKASSHIGDYVQILVFVQKSTPVQYKSTNGGEIIRTDIQVGDDTRRFFPVSIWQKQLGALVVAGDVILLQNVKLMKFGDVVEAKTVQQSYLQSLIHPQELIVSKDVVDLIENHRIGIATKEKLRKVIEWVQHTGSTLYNVDSNNNKRRILPINWKVHEERQTQDCFSLLEVSLLIDMCKATFYASVGEIFIPLTFKSIQDSDRERMFISRRLLIMGDKKLVEDLICTGCQICGSPLDSEFGSTIEQTTTPLYCQKSSDHLHVVCLIYRPFMLYVWDDSKYIPLLVTNKAAELLFGNIKAERVYSCYKKQLHRYSNNQKNIHKENLFCKGAVTHPNGAEGGTPCSNLADSDTNRRPKGKNQCSMTPNFYLIWLILMKMLLQEGSNSPLRFKVVVNSSKDWESGRYEVVSVSFPCFRSNASTKGQI